MRGHTFAKEPRSPKHESGLFDMARSLGFNLPIDSRF